VRGTLFDPALDGLSGLYLTDLGGLSGLYPTDQGVTLSEVRLEPLKEDWRT
jgi:hypothetical protein